MKDNVHLLLLDNYDSFTYNLYDYFEQLGAHVTVMRNDQISIPVLKAQNFDGIVLSPGPGRPQNAGLLMEVIDCFCLNLPILGICLGMQALGEYFGAKLVHAFQPVHGKTSVIYHNKKGLFEHVKWPSKVMRYHSLLLKELPNCLIPLAWTEEEELMAIQHITLPLYGVQFHPESILTEDGLIILNNWLKTCQKE